MRLAEYIPQAQQEIADISNVRSSLMTDEDRADAGPGAFTGAFTGASTALFTGIEHGVETSVAAFGDTIKQITPDSWAEWVDAEQAKAKSEMAGSRANPATMGIVAQLLHQLGSIAVYGATGGVAAGPVGAAANIGVMSGYDKANELMDQGVDVGTATTAGLIEGAVMGVGAGLPGYMGKTLAKQVASGVGLNLGLGVAERGGIGTVLESNGYNDVAKHYQAFDKNAMLIDGVLGGLFPVGARLISKSSPAYDAALAHEQKAAADRSAGVVATDMRSFDQMAENANAVAEQLFVEGRSLRDVEVPNRDINAIADPDFIASVREIDAAVARQIEESIGMTRADVEALGAARIADDMDTTLNVVDSETGKINDVTPDMFAIAEAQSTVNALGDFDVRIELPDNAGGAVVKDMKASELLDYVRRQEREAEIDNSLYRTAVACALSHGE